MTKLSLNCYCLRYEDEAIPSFGPRGWNYRFASQLGPSNNVEYCSFTSFFFICALKMQVLNAANELGLARLQCPHLYLNSGYFFLK